MCLSDAALLTRHTVHKAFVSPTIHKGTHGSLPFARHRYGTLRALSGACLALLRHNQAAVRPRGVPLPMPGDRAAPGAALAAPRPKCKKSHAILYTIKRHDYNILVLVFREIRR
jgi:hypothetical protein